MKIFKGSEGYKASATERKASFTLRLINSFWKSVKPEELKLLRPKYFEVNRALDDAVSENVDVLCTTWTVDRRQKDHTTPEHVKHVLAQRIADALVKSERLPICELENPFTGATEYKIQIPIFVLKDDPRNQVIVGGGD